MTPRRKKTRTTPASDTASSSAGTGRVYALSCDVLDRMSEVLSELVETGGARCAAVVDCTGCIMGSEGDFAGVDPGTMGATAAATIAALNKMVSRESSQEVSVRFYGAALDRIHFVVVDSRLTLCLLYKHGETGEGIRAAARSAAKRIAENVAEDRDNGLGRDQKDLIESVGYIENKLDELFKDLQG